MLFQVALRSGSVIVEYEIELSFLGETYRCEFKLTDSNLPHVKCANLSRALVL